MSANSQEKNISTGENHFNDTNDGRNKQDKVEQTSTDQLVSNSSDPEQMLSSELKKFKEDSPDEQSSAMEVESGHLTSAKDHHTDTPSLDSPSNTNNEKNTPVSLSSSSNDSKVYSSNEGNPLISANEGLESTSNDNVTNQGSPAHDPADQPGETNDPLGDAGEHPLPDSEDDVSQNKRSVINDRWFDLQFHPNTGNQKIKKPNELENEIPHPPSGNVDQKIIDRISGSIIGMAIGDALGAHVEFRPRQYLQAHPVEDLSSGGTWGLEVGQFTDDTSMALCLAASLIAREDFDLYDQLVRYKWWYQHGYMSSTGHCFDIGAATSQSLREFQRRQKTLSNKHGISVEQLDQPSHKNLVKDFKVYCSGEEVAGNGALMRLAPVPLFFYRHPDVAVEYSGQSGQITHGDVKAYDACRYYGALIVAALNEYSKEQILDDQFYSKHKHWFHEKKLHPDIQSISEGSYKKKSKGYEDGIRGGGYIVKALEAALWAFSSTDDFKTGALAAVNLGDDTDTTAAIYGQLAGAFYGYKQLPHEWRRKVYAKNFLMKISQWIYHKGLIWNEKQTKIDPVPKDTSSVNNTTNSEDESQTDEQEKMQEGDSVEQGAGTTN